MAMIPAMAVPRLLFPVLAAALAACSAEGGEVAGATEAPVVLTSPSASVTSTEPTPLGAPADYSFCKDGSGDGGAIDFGGGKVRRDGDMLQVTWTLNDVPLATGTALYSVTASNADGTGTRQYGVKYQDGKQVGYFVFDFSTGKQQNVDGAANFNDSDLMANFPLSGLSDGFRYSLGGTVDGEDVERCPDDDSELITYDGP